MSIFCMPHSQALLQKRNAVAAVGRQHLSPSFHSTHFDGPTRSLHWAMTVERDTWMDGVKSGRILSVTLASFLATVPILTSLLLHLHQ